MTTAPGLSVFFPAYNDAGTIASLVITALTTAQTLTPDYEVIVVNDGSADDTAEILDELARIYPRLRVVHHGKNRGYGGALRSGFATASKELVFYTDGDAQYDPAEMTVLWRAHAPTTSICVNGYKISRSDPLHRIVIGRIYHHTVKMLFGLKVRDVDCDFRLMRRSIFDACTLEKNSGVICLEMMKKITDAGFRIAEVPVHHYHRALRQVAVLQLPPPRPHRRSTCCKLWFALVVRRVAPARAAGGRRRAPRPAAPRHDRDYRDFYRGRRVMVTGGLGLHRQQPGARSWSTLGADVLLVDSLIPDYGGNLFNIDGIESTASASTSPTSAQADDDELPGARTAR